MTDFPEGPDYMITRPGGTVEDAIKRIRQDRGMSQTALAKAMVERGHAAWRQTTVSRTEQGTRELKLSEVSTLRRIFTRGSDPHACCEGHKPYQRNSDPDVGDAEALNALAALVYHSSLRDEEREPLLRWLHSSKPTDPGPSS